MKTQPSKRHFPYQHPTFGSERNPKPASAWMGTVYYWWWAYLKRSDRYIACCEQGGSGDLAELYADFGDVRGDSFKQWWLEDSRGLRLFAEPRGEDSVRILTPDDQVLSQSEALTVSLPLYLPRRHLERAFKQLLAQVHPGKRGIQLAKHSQARYRVHGQPNTKALQKGLEVYDRWKSSKEPLWKIGNDLPGIIRTQKINANELKGEEMLKRRALAATVRRYISRVEQSIQNVEVGVFP